MFNNSYWRCESFSCWFFRQVWEGGKLCFFLADNLPWSAPTGGEPTSENTLNNRWTVDFRDCPVSLSSLSWTPSLEELRDHSLDFIPNAGLDFTMKCGFDHFSCLPADLESTHENNNPRRKKEAEKLTLVTERFMSNNLLQIQSDLRNISWSHVSGAHRAPQQLLLIANQ